MGPPRRRRLRWTARADHGERRQLLDRGHGGRRDPGLRLPRPGHVTRTRGAAARRSRWTVPPCTDATRGGGGDTGSEDTPPRGAGPRGLLPTSQASRAHLQGLWCRRRLRRLEAGTSWIPKTFGPRRPPPQVPRTSGATSTRRIHPRDSAASGTCRPIRAVALHGLAFTPLPLLPGGQTRFPHDEHLRCTPSPPFGPPWRPPRTRLRQALLLLVKLCFHKPHQLTRRRGTRPPADGWEVREMECDNLSEHETTTASACNDAYVCAGSGGKGVCVEVSWNAA